jgi:hypothetical protein
MKQPAKLRPDVAETVCRVMKEAIGARPKTLAPHYERASGSRTTSRKRVNLTASSVAHLSLLQLTAGALADPTENRVHGSGMRCVT